MTPLAIDLFCGLGGWTEGLLAEDYRVVGFDVERHRYPARSMPTGEGTKSVGIDLMAGVGAPSASLSFNY